MRTGAIFARGSCRALKWIVALGVLSVLGSAQEAVAQPTVESTGAAEYLGAVVTVEVTDTGSPGTAHNVTGTPDGTDFEIGGDGCDERHRVGQFDLRSPLPPPAPYRGGGPWAIPGHWPPTSKS